MTLSCESYFLVKVENKVDHGEQLLEYIGRVGAIHSCNHGLFELI